jgi:hypothetical protein
VSETATVEEIKSAWRKLTLVAHPDHGGTSALFQLTQDAYQLLSDPLSRQDFDEGHHPVENNQPPPPPPKGPSESQRSNGPQAAHSSTSQKNDAPKSDTVKRRPTRTSFAWFIVVSANLIITTHYNAIVAANETNLANGTRGSFILMTPWRDSVATLTFLRGDVWIRYASVLFLLGALVVLNLNAASRSPSWLKNHNTTARVITFVFGLAISLPLLITGAVWAFSFITTVAIITVVLGLVVAFVAAL